MSEKNEKKKSSAEDEDVREFKEVMNTLKETVPEIIKGIVDAIYSGTNAEEFGKQVANFYKSMVDVGMDKEEAYELTKKFMESRDISGIIKKILSEGNLENWKSGNVDSKKVSSTIKNKVNEELKRVPGETNE